MTLFCVPIGLCLWMACRLAPTYDETGHMAAGLSHLEFSRFELYRVNPPLARSITSLPIYFMPHAEDWRGYRTDNPTRQEFSLGWRFVDANGRDAPRLFLIARVVGLCFLLLGAWGCYVTARRWHGRAGGFAACGLWLYSPTVLGHAPLLTPDVAGAPVGLLAVYSLIRWIEVCSWENAWLCGVAVACAMATKATWIILPPVVVGVVCLRALTGFVRKRSAAAHQAGKLLGQLTLIAGICVLFVNSLYAFSGFLKPLGAFSFRSVALAGENEDRWNHGNRFESTWLGKVPSPLHANYNPRALGLAFSIPDQSVTDGPPPPGLYAIDVNFLMGYPYALPSDQGGRVTSKPEFWTRFQQSEPIDQIGYSIFVYHVPDRMPSE